jgi:hypothetical protein
MKTDIDPGLARLATRQVRRHIRRLTTHIEGMHKAEGVEFHRHGPGTKTDQELPVAGGRS